MAVVIVLTSFVLAGQAAATTFVFRPSQDAYVDQAAPTTNFGGSASLNIKWSNGAGSDRRTYLTFHLQKQDGSAASSVVGTIKSVQLRLYMSTSSSQWTIQGQKIASTWCAHEQFTTCPGSPPTDITWSNQPALGASTFTISCSTLTTPPCPTAPAWLDISLPTSVWPSPTELQSDISFELQGTSSDPAVSAYNRDVMVNDEQTSSCPGENCGDHAPTEPVPQLVIETTQTQTGSTDLQIPTASGNAADADSWVDEAAPTSTHASDQALHVQADSGSGNERRAFLRFVSNGVSATAVMNKVELHLASRNHIGHPGIDVHLCVRCSIDFSSLSWNTAPGPCSLPIGPSAANCYDPAVVGQSGDLGWEQSFKQEYVIPLAIPKNVPTNGTLILVLTSTNTGNGAAANDLLFASAESTDSTYATKPLLDVNYTASVLSTTSQSPLADSYVDEAHPTSNYGTAQPLLVNGSASPARKWALLLWTISTVPSGASVRDCYLKIGATAALSHDLTLYQSSDTAWSEGGVTWNNEFGSGGTNPTLTRIADLAGDNTTGYQNFRIPLANCPGNGAYSVVIEAPDSTTDIQLNSRDFSSPPKLTIDYTADATLEAAGDLACRYDGTITTNKCQTNATAALLDTSSSNTILSLGDDQYECGLTAAENGTSTSDWLTDIAGGTPSAFGSTWGTSPRFARLFPGIGNHEYATDNGSFTCNRGGSPAVSPPNKADGYCGFFGDQKTVGSTVLNLCNTSDHSATCHDQSTATTPPFWPKCPSAIWLGAGNNDAELPGTYAFDVGSWHIVSINTENASNGNFPTDVVGLVNQWLGANLTNNDGAGGKPCVLAYWHEPRWSSGEHGSQPGTTSATARAAIYHTLYSHHVDVLLVGHDHNYERFDMMGDSIVGDPPGAARPFDFAWWDGTPDPSNGIREFVVGIGGKSNRTDQHRSATSDAIQYPKPGSQIDDIRGSDFGILKLYLHGASFEWQTVAATPTAGTDHLVVQNEDLDQTASPGYLSETSSPSVPDGLGQLGADEGAQNCH